MEMSLTAGVVTAPAQTLVDHSINILRAAGPTVLEEREAPELAFSLAAAARESAHADPQQPDVPAPWQPAKAYEVEDPHRLTASPSGSPPLASSDPESPLPDSQRMPSGSSAADGSPAPRAGPAGQRSSAGGMLEDRAAPVVAQAEAEQCAPNFPDLGSPPSAATAEAASQQAVGQPAAPAHSPEPSGSAPSGAWALGGPWFRVAAAPPTQVSIGRAAA